MDLTPLSHVSFCPLLFRQEDDDFLVGREDLAQYVQMPEVGVEIIKALDAGATVGEATDELSRKYGDDVPVADFVESMIENRFVREVDGVVLETVGQARYHMRKARLERLAWLYSKPAYVTYGVIALVLAGLLLFVPGYFPRSRDFFPFKSYSVNLLLAFVLSTLSLCVHELSHLAAARSIGVNGRFSMSNRLIFLVAQTDITNVWSRPREERYIPYLAGMAVDAVQMFLWVVVLLFRDAAGLAVPFVICGVAKQRILQLFMGILWQFRFYMQTDVYYVITNWLGCRNLIADARAYLVSLARRLAGRSAGNPSWSDDRERRITKVFSLFYLGGVVITLVVFFGFTVPIVVRGCSGSIRALMAGFSAGHAGFLDGVAFLLLAGLQYGLLLYVTLGRRLRQWRQRRAATGVVGEKAVAGVSTDNV